MSRAEGSSSGLEYSGPEMLRVMDIEAPTPHDHNAQPEEASTQVAPLNLEKQLRS